MNNKFNEFDCKISRTRLRFKENNENLHKTKNLYRVSSITFFHN